MTRSRRPARAPQPGDATAVVHDPRPASHGATNGEVRPPSSDAPPVVRIEDPLALFVPERQLVGAVPLPLYLLELVPGSVRLDYERTESGTVKHEADRIRRRTVHYPGGVNVQIEVHGDQVRGLPTTFDYDYFLALCRIADEGGVDAQGYFVDPGYRAVLRAAGRSDDAIGGEQVDAVKRAFARFGGLILYTKLDVDYAERSGQVRAGLRHPLVPDGTPPIREREGKHWVLEYDVEGERRRDTSYNSIERLRINPLWLDQATAGIAAWMDVALHNSLRSGYAKRLLQLFTVRSARGWRVFDPWVLDLRELYDLIEVPATQWGLTQTRQGVTNALQTLTEHGVLGEASITKVARGRYDVTLAAGERLLAASFQRGTGAGDRIGDRMLLWHLRAVGFSAPQARELVRARPDQVRTVLRRVYYLQAVKGGLSNGRPVEDWAAWTRAAIEGEYAFSDPEWQRWLAAQLEAAPRGEWIAGRTVGPVAIVEGAAGRHRFAVRAAASESASDGTADVPEASGADALHRDAASATGSAAPATSFADDPWGRALERFVADGPEHGRAYQTWLARTALDRVGDGEVTVLAEDAFTAEWISTKYRDPLASYLSAIVGRPVDLVVRAHGAGRGSATADADAPSQTDLFSGERAGANGDET